MCVCVYMGCFWEVGSMCICVRLCGVSGGGHYVYISVYVGHV